MRALLAFTLLAFVTALAAGGIALAGTAASEHARAPAAGRRPATADAASRAAGGSCSSVSGCVQGCALPVAATVRVGRSPTAPCAKSTLRACSEYVANVPRPASPGCEGAILYGERLLPPNLLRSLKRRPAQRAAGETLRRADRRARRAAREALRRAR